MNTNKIIAISLVLIALLGVSYVIYSWSAEWRESNDVIRLIQNDVYRYVASIKTDIIDIEDILGSRTVVNKSEMQRIWTITNATNNTLFEFAFYKNNVFVESSDIDPMWIQIRYQNCFDEFFALKEFKLKHLEVKT